MFWWNTCYTVEMNTQKGNLPNRPNKVRQVTDNLRQSGSVADGPRSGSNGC
jgi:hypothetical protein